MLKCNSEQYGMRDGSHILRRQDRMVYDLFGGGGASVGVYVV